MADVVLLNSGGSNYTSLQSAFERLGASCKQSANADDIANASHVVLPGVGSAASAMQAIKQQSLAGIIRGLKQPLLGICLGMQVLFDYSEESDINCLGIIAGNIRKLPATQGIRVPHMGWNTVTVQHGNQLLNGLDGKDFYFVHSYAAEVAPQSIALSEHGVQFTAATQQGNFYGVQFHPERSGMQGQQLLENFLSIST